MAYFARAVHYAGTNNEGYWRGYWAIVEIARHKGEEPFRFLVYRYMESEEGGFFSSIEVKDRAGAERIFPGAIGYEWQATTKWLHRAVCAKKEYSLKGKWCQEGVWVRVGAPARFKNRRKKRPLRVGELGHLLLARRSEILFLREELSRLECEHRVKEFDGSTKADMEHPAVIECANRVAKAEDELAALYAEMRYKTYRKFPEPAGKVPKRVTNERLRDLRAWYGG